MDIFTQLLSPQQNFKNRLEEKEKKASVVCLMNRAIALTFSILYTREVNQ